MFLLTLPPPSSPSSPSLLSHPSFHSSSFSSLSSSCVLSHSALTSLLSNPFLSLDLPFISSPLCLLLHFISLSLSHSSLIPSPPNHPIPVSFPLLSNSSFILSPSPHLIPLLFSFLLLIPFLLVSRLFLNVGWILSRTKPCKTTSGH